MPKTAPKMVPKSGVLGVFFLRIVHADLHLALCLISVISIGSLTLSASSFIPVLCRNRTIYIFAAEDLRKVPPRRYEGCTLPLSSLRPRNRRRMRSLRGAIPFVAFSRATQSFNYHCSRNACAFRLHAHPRSAAALPSSCTASSDKARNQSSTTAA